jgi:hypothetical protein
VADAASQAVSAVQDAANAASSANAPTVEQQPAELKDLLDKGLITQQDYLNLLETSYQLVRLPAYAVNRTKRFIKTPKLYLGDTGIALHLAEGAEPDGPHLENLILADLLAWRDARLESCELFYWRSTIGEEVDFVIETGGRLLPIEVKASARPRLGDARHLLTIRAEYGRKAGAGLLLHTGKTLQWRLMYSRFSYHPECGVQQRCSSNSEQLNNVFLGHSWDIFSQQSILSASTTINRELVKRL